MAKENIKNNKKEPGLAELYFRIMKQKISRDEFIILEKRVAILEKSKK